MRVDTCGAVTSVASVSYTRNGVSVAKVPAMRILGFLELKAWSRKRDSDCVMTDMANVRRVLDGCSGWRELT